MHRRLFSEANVNRTARTLTGTVAHYKSSPPKTCRAVQGQKKRNNARSIQPLNLHARINDHAESDSFWPQHGFAKVSRFDCCVPVTGSDEGELNYPLRRSHTSIDCLLCLRDNPYRGVTYPCVPFHCEISSSTHRVATIGVDRDSSRTLPHSSSVRMTIRS